MVEYQLMRSEFHSQSFLPQKYPPPSPLIVHRRPDTLKIFLTMQKMLHALRAELLVRGGRKVLLDVELFIYFFLDNSS